MPINNDRRHYLTLPDAQYKVTLGQEAKGHGVSMSKYIIERLELLKRIELSPMGIALLDQLRNGASQLQQ